MFLEDARVPLSDHSAEWVVRDPLVGSKNFAGCKWVRGTAAAAVLHTLLESAKRARIEPQSDHHAAARAALKGGPPDA